MPFMRLLFSSSSHSSFFLKGKNPSESGGYSVLIRSIDWVRGFLNGMGFYEPVWYTCLKTKNCYLKIFVKIRMDEKVYENA